MQVYLECAFRISQMVQLGQVRDDRAVQRKSRCSGVREEKVKFRCTFAGRAAGLGAGARRPSAGAGVRSLAGHAQLTWREI